jgi:hypothetical protein
MFLFKALQKYVALPHGQTWPAFSAFCDSLVSLGALKHATFLGEPVQLDFWFTVPHVGPFLHDFYALSLQPNNMLAWGGGSLQPLFESNEQAFCPDRNLHAFPIAMRRTYQQELYVWLARHYGL